MDANPSELKEKISQLSDEELLQMVNINFAEYRGETLDFAKAEMERRNLPVTQIEKEPSQAKDPTGDLKQVYQDYAKAVGGSEATLGCLVMLIIIAGIISCFYISWLLGIIGSIAMLVVMGFISNRMEAPHKKRAKECVSQLEKQYELSHQESFDLLLATRSRAKDGDKREWRTFVTEVWGGAALASEQKQELTLDAAVGSTICPLCKSDSVARKSEFKSSKAGHFAGQALFGIVGNMVLGAAFGRKTENCECKSCGHKWVSEKPVPKTSAKSKQPSLFD